MNIFEFYCWVNLGERPCEIPPGYRETAIGKRKSGNCFQ